MIRSAISILQRTAVSRGYWQTSGFDRQAPRCASDNVHQVLDVGGRQGNAQGPLRGGRDAHRNRQEHRHPQRPAKAGRRGDFRGATWAVLLATGYFFLPVLFQFADWRGCGCRHFTSPPPKGAQYLECYRFIKSSREFCRIADFRQVFYRNVINRLTIATRTI